ncbi:MAG: bifunctional 5,10-methylene-tetrahydrofolate dehydrogenase/5,10-methylene-tetrahydrofolate cyclohydrolase, partial [Thermoplasmata archaeon]|nr:bifunctional 5,10-methylene-tetrahydrofolate dehydrogenase/5,10-methylene-tetrahydrofolate cyclohydrolase [Thermoplasmata archaeon]NIS12562.1 bifunctional 5,10-methylene-tetrahydrofolate dehydrogenase/5,10-methylene-tetrahydrofolate cyclohydrolase [Thermoplasmata archaeon]NIS20480.1 bifunctional 5,10-methylene-tetrahydrofolate dehydrogenase/5,10-methylene-tetrahydrofolate cyclohydrolase [Thermoplasmata archaeon]NIT77842.1 bifunctional 5,10-methylene-tetrahydrofolate dehydrogenase/5,10-methyle
MTAELISGTAISKEIKAELKEEVAAFTEKYGFAPHITVILVGDNPASASYVGMKEKTAKKL